MDMLHSFSLFIYKRQLPWSHPHPQSVLPQTGTRFLSGWEERLDQEEGDFVLRVSFFLLKAKV